MRRRVVLLVYLALFVGELSWQGVAPLIPTYVETYDLTDAAGGAVLSLASVGILVTSLPAGYLTRHVSPRMLTIAAMGVIAVSDLLMIVAPSYTFIVAARLVFGIGFGALWVSMAAWLADAAGDDSPRVLAATTAVVGVGALLGPAYTGAVAERFGIGAPFVGLAVITLALLVLLALDRSGTGMRKEPGPPVRELVSAVGRDWDLSTMLLLTVAASMVWLTADLLVPLRMGRADWNAAQIGVVFSLSSLIFVGASALTARRADRLTRHSVVAAATGVLAAFTVIPALLAGVPASVVFLLGASVTTGVTIALTFPFGLLAVERGHVTVAVMSALSNIVWAISGIVGPVVGGVFAEWAGDQVAFAVLAAVCLVVAVAVGRAHLRSRAAD
ncbi:MAG TPA: MFS transporter [Candidatus Nanopelagicales bacterium]|nr:MFS transporter [Candidatus Nanopelagicales bacterium]